MKFKIEVSNGATQWSEEYDKPEVTDQKTANKFGDEVVRFFNGTLQPGEKPRKFIAAELIGPGSEVVFESCQAANDALGPCPRALADSDGGHWWYVDYDAEEAAESDGEEKDFINCECKSCPQKMRLSSDADEIPF
jgi:hypothetical protein